MGGQVLERCVDPQAPGLCPVWPSEVDDPASLPPVDFGVGEPLCGRQPGALVSRGGSASLIVRTARGSRQSYLQAIVDLAWPLNIYFWRRPLRAEH